MTSPWLSVHDRVARALAGGGPVVALETTLVTHGLPKPAGLTAAMELEARVRAQGATPASIGVIGARVRVGLTPDELSHLATADVAEKVNPSNLAAVLTSGGVGSTTVAATMFVARTCGISVFATGGIGGVHRAAAESGDISADLAALARTPVAVVSAGAKAILDLPRTVEALETLGVPVLGWRTDEFPAFYRRSSGLRVDRRFDRIDALADTVRAHLALAPGTGLLVVNPIPEDEEMDRGLYERALDTALSDAAVRSIHGRAVTPFLLDRLRELTGGESVRANLALLRHNADLAGALAVAMAGVRS